jgi:hypothetical protein
LNSGLHICKAGALPLEPVHQQRLREFEKSEERLRKKEKEV